MKLQSPETKTAVRKLKYLRLAWGADNFDRAWKEKTGSNIPDWLKDDGKELPEDENKK